MGKCTKNITRTLWVALTCALSCVQYTYATTAPAPTTSFANPIVIANKSAHTAEITISYKAAGGHFFAKAPQSEVNIIIGPGQPWVGGKQAPIKSIYGKLFNPQGASYSPQTKTRYSKLQPINPDKNYEYNFEIKAQVPGHQEYKIKQVKVPKKTTPAPAPQTATDAAVRALTNPGLFAPPKR